MSEFEQGEEIEVKNYENEEWRARKFFVEYSRLFYCESQYGTHTLIEWRIARKLQPLTWPDDAPDWANFWDGEDLWGIDPGVKSVTRPNYMEGRAYQTEKQFYEWAEGKRIRWTGWEVTTAPNGLRSLEGFAMNLCNMRHMWIEVPPKKRIPWDFKDYLDAMPISHLKLKGGESLHSLDFLNNAGTITAGGAIRTYQDIAKNYTLSNGDELYK